MKQIRRLSFSPPPTQSLSPARPTRRTARLTSSGTPARRFRGKTPTRRSVHAHARHGWSALDRLNAGAPVFDTHFTGDDYKSVVAGKAGTKAQVGVVNKAWADGTNGMATLKFDLGDEDGAELFRKVSSGIVQNLSFGAWIYNREKTTVQAQTEGKPPYGNPNRSGCSRRPIGNRSKYR